MCYFISNKKITLQVHVSYSIIIIFVHYARNSCLPYMPHWAKLENQEPIKLLVTPAQYQTAMQLQQHFWVTCNCILLERQDDSEITSSVSMLSLRWFRSSNICFMKDVVALREI